MHLENTVTTNPNPAFSLIPKAARAAKGCQQDSEKYPSNNERTGVRNYKEVSPKDTKNVLIDEKKVQSDAKQVKTKDTTVHASSQIGNTDLEKAEILTNNLINIMPDPLPIPTETNAPPKARLFCSVRLMTAFIAMAALFLNYCIIFSMTFAMLCMTKQTGRHALRFSVTQSKPEFNWNRTTQGLLLSAFYVGFSITLIAGGFVADLYNAKLVLVFGNLMQGSLSIMLPELTRLMGAPALAAVRILQGLASGVVVPCIYVLLSKWAASVERTRLLGVAYLGIPLSEIVIFPLSGFLCGLNLDKGWPLIFYVLGIVTVIFTLMLQFLVFEWPSQHPLVSTKEREFLEYRSVKQIKKKRPPWLDMAKSPAVWSYCFCYCSQQWGFQVMSVFTPQFMQDVMNFHLHQNGILSAVPYIGMLIMRAAQTSVFNAVREKTKLSVTTLRKINHGIGTWVPATALLCMHFVKDSPAACVILLTINMTIQDLAFTGGFGFCNVDFGPAFAGILSGIGMSTSILLCIAMPNIVAGITPTGTLAEWMNVFYITAASYIVAFIVYNRCGTSELQPWGLGTSESDTAQQTVKPGQEPTDKSST